MYVMDGFWHAVDAMQAPSVTHRFFTSWHWLWPFSTDVFGSRPIRAVPISWIVRPGGLSSTNGVMSFAPRGVEHLRRGDRHVVQQFALVVTPGTVNPQRGNPPSVDRDGVELDVVGGPREALAKPVERKAPRSLRVQGALELHAEPRLAGRPTPAGAPAAPLKPVASQELGMRRLHIAEPGDVDPVGPVSVDRAVFYARDHAPRAPAHRMIHQVLAQLAARVGEPGREARGLRVQEDAGGLERRSAQEDDACAELERLARLRVDDADAGGAVALAVVDHTVHDAVRPQGEADAVEVRMRDAATLAGPAVMARRAAAMRRGEDRDPADRHDPLGGEPLGDAVPDHLLGAVQRHRRQELPVGQLRQSQPLAAHPDEPFHVVVPRRDVGVADRPVHAEAVPRVGLEIEIAPAVYLPAPHDGLAADLAATDPVKRLVGSKV